LNIQKFFHLRKNHYFCLIIYFQYFDIMIYEIDNFYDFRIIGGKEPYDEYFILEVDSPAGPGSIQLKKLPFQRNPAYNCPAYLSCKVKYIDDNGLPAVAPNIINYVNNLYEKEFARGDSFECTVVSVPANPTEEPYSICDKNGIFFRLNDSEGMLAKGQKVRMCFTKLTPRFFELSRVDEGAQLFFYPPGQLLDCVVGEHHLKKVLLQLFDRLQGMDAACAEAKAHNPLWVMTACRTALREMSEWFLHGNVSRHHRIYYAMLRALRDILLYLLEGSGFLNAAPAEQRRAIQQQLTDMADALEPYGLALKLISRNGEDAFVEGLLDKLQKSGYLYHPARQFAVLILIFRLNPDKVGTYLNRIFDSIFGRDLDNWKREPFRSAFVEQFQIYVQQTRSDIDSMPIAESREQKARVETVITAIALQMLLSDDYADFPQIESLFYRYVALLRPLNVESLLSKAYVSLMGGDVSTRLTYNQLKEPMMMMTQATVMPSDDIFSHINIPHRFSGGGVDIEISRKGMVIRPSRRNDITERAIPDGLMSWLNPQIMVNGVHSLSGNKIRKINEHKLWWHSIDNALFEQQFRHDDEKERMTADKGDRVYIVIDNIDGYDGETPVFRCHIDDQEYNEGGGLMRCDSIVGYKLRQPPRRAFRTPNGDVRGFFATVIDKDDDGMYWFSLTDRVDSYIDETFSYEEEYKAVITGINENDYSAICDLGVGLFLEREHNREYTFGDIVSFRLSHKGCQGKLRGYITAMCDAEEDGFDKNDAFLTLMEAIGEVDGDSNATNMVRDIDEILNSEQVRELIEIIRFKAVCETDLIKAYDYLNLAKILAKVLGDASMVNRLETHATLLTMHQFFAINSRIDTDSLDSIRAEAEADSFLNLIYRRLKMVSWLGRHDKNDELYRTAENPSGELEGSIARMVLAYNMLSNDDTEGSSIAGDIKHKIMEKLNVNNETRHGKYYGSESKYLEFKTSIVYPATAPGEDMREAPQEQQFHILSRIAGLLNANGGRLYLGVNNDGFEVGLHDDFLYFERHKATVNGYQFKVSNLDSLTVFLEELVNQTFGPKVGRKITISIDDEAEKGVVLFDIEQSLEPIFLDGRLFVRQSGQATREYHGEAVNEFVREREDLLTERQHALALHKKEQLGAVAIPAPKPKEDATDKPAQPAKASEKTVKTSLWRHNILHDYENGYHELFGYLYFTSEGNIVFSTRDINLDNKESTILSLAIPHELAKGFLLLCYEEERVLKIPLREIYEQASSSPAHYNTDFHLMFAAIADRNDGLMCVGADSGMALSQRLTMLSQIANSHLNSTPKRIHNAPNNHTVAYEIADASVIDNFADSMAEKLGSKRFGFTMRVKEDSPNANYKLNELFKSCASTAI